MARKSWTEETNTKKSSTSEGMTKKVVVADPPFSDKVGRPGFNVGNISKVGDMKTTTEETIND